MPEREFYDEDDWLRSGGNLTYGGAVSPTEMIDPFQVESGDWTTRYPWWHDPDNAPPDWMLQSGHPPIQATPGYYWGWAGDHWEMRQSPTSPTYTDNQPKTTPTPRTPDTTPPPGDNTGGGGWGFQPIRRIPPPSLAYPELTLPRFATPDPFVYEDFKAPTLADAQSEPGFDYALKEGIKAYENSKAYLGTYRTGGTIKGLNDYARNMANQNYNQVFDRKAQTYDRNRSNAADTYATNYGISRDVFDRNYLAAKDEFQPKARAAELQFARDWDVWQYEGDDDYRRWKARIDANSY